jgi:hypothetical protein
MIRSFERPPSIVAGVFPACHSANELAKIVRDGLNFASAFHPTKNLAVRPVIRADLATTIGRQTPGLPANRKTSRNFRA